MQVRAVADHEIPTRSPIRVRPGEVVEVGERDEHWPAFVFITSAAGQGWVPERHLDGEGPTAGVLVAYDTQELPVSAGEELTVLANDDQSGWSWCRNQAGDQGWVPQECLG